ncbi:MAG: ABC-F family ATP-binding cassette domain-containing protein [Planctomycetes bacterium]|nr:ABC-F family ATP-binding cassette domain-containing protein [Planctomycetota bacterium]MCC7395490.1 ABC-F family ATP-binding cassette domain-containing protein [Planctomycetota bacterium]
MTLVTLDKIVRRFGDEAILDGLSLRIDEGDRIGVVGDNGAGKTTMVRILAGVDDADTGQRNTRRGLRIAYGAQMPAMPKGSTVQDFVMRGTGEHDALERRMRQLEAGMVAGEPAALRDYGELQAAFEAGGGYDRKHRVEKVLSGLGFQLADLQKDVSVLSGGESSRVQLAILMTTPADLLMLDEPTNHLDLQGIEFVEDFVVRYPGAVLVVSHDRRFLDAIATSIVEVGDGVATRYKGNFSHYRQQRDLALLSQARQFKSQREFIDKEMDYIRRNMAGRMSAQAKGRLKRLQRLQLIDKPKGNRAQMRLTFGKTTRGQQGQVAIEGEDITVKAGPRVLIEHGMLRVWFGEITALLGRNGAGKTTLLRLLAGIGQPAAGALRFAHNLRIGYFSQEKNDLPQQGTVLEALRELDRTVNEGTLRDHLALFLFCGDDVDKPVTELSGGEKQRLSLARMTRAQFDLLCLDEPTNHLDVAGTEGLEQALKEFPGTVVLITHDRALVEQVADRVAWVENGAIRTFDQGLAQCQRVLADERAAARAAEAAERERLAKKAEAAAPPVEAKKAIETGKVRNPLLFQRLEERIMTLEAAIESTRAAMLAPENYASASKMKDLQAEQARLERELAEAYIQWENWQ